MPKKRTPAPEPYVDSRTPQDRWQDELDNLERKVGWKAKHLHDRVRGGLTDMDQFLSNPRRILDYIEINRETMAPEEYLDALIKAAHELTHNVVWGIANAGLAYVADHAIELTQTRALLEGMKMERPTGGASQ